MVTIRKYKLADKNNLRHICKATAGDYFTSSQRLIDAVPVLYNDYFTENEPENIFVIADENDNAVGYVICTCHSKSFMKKMLTKYIPRATAKHIKMFFPCVGYIATIVANGKDNRTHLHIDILPEYQHKGYGTKLIDELRNHLYSEGISRLSINVIDRKSSAYKFYIKYGFTECKHLTGNLVSLSISTKTEVKI